MSSTQASHTAEPRTPFLASTVARRAARRSGAGGDAPPSRFTMAAVLVLGAALAGVTILRGIAPHDEGLMLQAGSRIASGQWPYRDFWTNYPPGQPLLLAGLQTVFGPSLLSWRVLRIAVDAITTLLVYLMVRRRTGEATALLAALAAAGAMAFPTGPGPNPIALALALGALLLAPRRPLAAGVLAGVTCLFRIEVGVAAVAGVVLAAPRGRRTTTGAVALAVGATTLAPFFAVAPGAMLHDLFGFYAIQGLQRVPFPVNFTGPVRPSKLIEFYLPLILVVGVAAWAAAITRRTVVAARERPVHQPGIAARSRLTRPAMHEFALAPLALVGLAYLLGRTDEFHLIPLSVVLAVMLAVESAASQGAVRAGLLVLLALIALHGLDRQGGQLVHPPPLAAVPGPAGDGVQTDRADAAALGALKRLVDRITRPGEPIFVANPRHDRVQAGDPLLYVVLGRPNPTRYDVMQPGLITTAAVQREIVRSLERADTRVVIRWLDPRATLIEHDGADTTHGAHILDAFLASRFRASARYGVYQVLVLRR